MPDPHPSWYDGPRQPWRLRGFMWGVARTLFAIAAVGVVGWIVYLILMWAKR